MRKLTPKFLGPYQILKKIGPVAYEVALPPGLANLHNVFHVSQLRKYIPDPKHVLEDEIQVRKNLTMEVDQCVYTRCSNEKLRGKDIRTVKVLWNEDTQEMDLGMEEFMIKEYP
ncbi:uncharacterized protein LOC124837969 [Vigna umbellata]|uniref:uncharacterized protein LOC124837969 n=1 Tax=Vigna umbellata TaxID=87088 RepID=UPI001F5F26C4|nr:uncharacterized protein LOC124837969 [Vigna umbellata]